MTFFSLAVSIACVVFLVLILKAMDTKEQPIVTETPHPPADMLPIQRVETVPVEKPKPQSQIERLIEQEEGKRREAYLDTNGKVTIAIGRSLQTHGISYDELLACVTKPDWKNIILLNVELKNKRLYFNTLRAARTILGTLSDDAIAVLLEADLQEAKADAQKAIGMITWQGIDEARQEAIVDLMFNLGLSHFLEFKEFIKHVRKNEWTDAAREVLLSKAARKHIARYHRIATVIETGDAKYFQLR